MHQHYEYQGQLLLANPTNPEDNLAEAAILITHCSDLGVRGVQINSVIQEISLDEIAINIGVPFNKIEPVYSGGGLEQNKIHLIHSVDWMGASSRSISKDLAVTIDISILAAISMGIGPKKFKACSGHWFWEHELLEQQINGQDEERYRWELVQATPELIFDIPDDSIWRRGLTLSTRQQISRWLD